MSGKGNARIGARPGAAMVVVDGLVKRYPKRPVNAVDGVSFEVGQGEIFGLLGPNGAGKTTTLGILTTRVRLSAGRALIHDVDVARDPSSAKRLFAVVPQRNNLDRALSARQNLLFHAAYFGLSRHEREQRADSLLEQFGLADQAHDKVDKNSGGMAQRLMIARALMHDPDLLFLDEPTTGLDPQARLFVWDRVRDLNARGLTVLMTTHDMDEAEGLCGRVAIMDHGKVLALDTPAALKFLVPGASALELRMDLADHEAYPEAGKQFADLVGALQSLPGVERVVTAPESHDGAGQWSGRQSSGDGTVDQGGSPAAMGSVAVRIYTARGEELIAPVVQAVVDRGAQVSDLSVSKASLEDVFIHLTGRALR